MLIIIIKATKEANHGANPIVRRIDNPENAIFEIKDTKLYVPVVTLSKENDIKLLEQLKTGFKRTIKWNKHRSQMTIQPQNNNLDYLIDPIFINVNRLFALVICKKCDNRGDNRDYFSHYYVPNAETEILMSSLMEKVSLTCQ